MKELYFLLVVNTEKDKNYEVRDRVSESIHAYFTNYDVNIETVNIDDFNFEVTNKYFLVFVIGGDGTALKALNRMNGSQVPVVGVNVGRVGFLTDIEVFNIEFAMEKISKFETRIKRHCYLEGLINNSINGKAVNDITISRNNFLGTIHLELKINGVYVNDYICDGFNISSAIGSTAYNKSLKGPIVFPDSPVFVLTPIGTSDNLFTSLVVPDDSVVEIKILRSEKDSCIVGFDGNNGVTLSNGDIVRISKSEIRYSLLHLDSYNYFENLKNKKK